MNFRFFKKQRVIQMHRHSVGEGGGGIKRQKNSVFHSLFHSKFIQSFCFCFRSKLSSVSPRTDSRINFRNASSQRAQFQHGLFTNGWETRSRDVWKPVSNRTPGIISKICKLGGGTPAPVCSGLLRPYKISHGLIRRKMTPAR